MAAKIIINPTSSSRREISLARTLVSIGRDPSNDLVLPDALVSRRHAVIEYRGSQYVLRDCNSSNGSLVNGDRVTELPLKDGDLLAIGTARMLFRQTEIEDAAAKVVFHPSAPRLQCPSCQGDYRRGDLFCRKCGQALPAPAPVHVVCALCGADVLLPANFCNACGAAVARGDGGATRPHARPDMPALVVERPASLAGEPPPSPESGGGPPPVAEVASFSAPAAAGAAVAPQVVIPARPSAPPLAWAAEPRAVRAPRPVPPSSHADRAAAAGTAETAPAPFGPRLAAALIDTAVVGAVQALLVAPGIVYFSRVFDAGRTTEPGFLPILLSVALVAVAVLLGGGYFVYYWGVKGATPGKRALGLIVRGEGGEFPIGVARALLRLLGYALSGALLGIGFLMVAFGGEGLHDRLASTRVVRVRTRS